MSSRHPLPAEPAGATSERRDAERFRALADAIAEIVFVTSADGRIVDMPRWREITGQTERDLTDFGWLAAIHPDDQAPTIAAWERSLASRSLFGISYRLRTRTGAFRAFDVRAAPVLDDAGAVREWVGVCIDVEHRSEVERARAHSADALQRSELRFRSLIEAVASVVWVLPPSGTFETEQESWTRYTGQSFARTRADGWIDMVHPDDRASTIDRWHDAHKTNTAYRVEHRLRRADGRHVPMIAHAIPILDFGGEVREWVGFHIDVSALRESESALRALTADLERRVDERSRELHAAHRALTLTNENLERLVAARTEALTTANEEVQRFAYIVSHDLRAPLVNIMGFANELRVLQGEFSTMLDAVSADSRRVLGDRPRELDRDMGESLDFILQSTAKMDRLIGAILRLSREGRRAFTAEPIDLHALLLGVRATLAHQAGESDATIEVAATLPTLHADRLAVEQVLTNLVENAIKYLEPGRPGLIRVDAGSVDGRVRIDVADNGRGIAPHDLERVFELFRRAGRQDRPGDGIGLAAAQAQVRRLGGTIACRSTPGSGSVFTVELPDVPSAGTPTA